MAMSSMPGSGLGDLIRMLGPSRPPALSRDVEVLTAEIGVLREALGLVAARLSEVSAELADRAGRERQRYVTVTRAAEMLGVTPKTVRNRLTRGSLFGLKDGSEQQGRWLVDVTSIERQL